MTMRRFVPVVAALFALIWALPAASRPHAAASKASKAYTAHATYTQTKAGPSDIGVEGKGSFSAKLGPAARLAAAVAHMATGVPYADLAKGGTFKSRINYEHRGIDGALLWTGPGFSACARCRGVTVDVVLPVLGLHLAVGV